MSAVLAGEIERWPTKDRMVDILCSAGLRVQAGRYSIRVLDCSHFIFQEYGGDPGDPSFDADGDTVDRLVHDACLVSAALAGAGIRHRFEIYDRQDDSGEIAAYLHHDWSGNPRSA